jgi:hypothetical protein
VNVLHSVLFDRLQIRTAAYPSHLRLCQQRHGMHKSTMPDYYKEIKAFYRSSQHQSKASPRTLYTLVGCGVFTIACGFIPYIVTQRMRPLNSRAEVCVKCVVPMFLLLLYRLICVIIFHRGSSLPYLLFLK